MMRVTNAILLVGLLLAGTMLVPYDYATRGAQPRPFAATSFTIPERFEIPAGKVLLPFPDNWGGATSLTIFDEKVYIPQTIGVNPGVAELRLESGNLVHPGSRWLNISIDAP